MRRRRAGFGRRTETDGRFARDHRRLVGFLRGLNGSCDGIHIVAVNRLHMPVACRKTCELVIRDRHVGAAVNRDAVVVEQHNQLR